jgi:exosortase
MQKAVGLTAGALLAGGLAAFLYADTLTKLISDWFRDENFSHGPLVLPAALFLVWMNRARIGRTPVAPAWGGAVVVAASLACLVAGRAASELFIARVSLIGVLVGTAALLFGWQQVRAQAFPIFLLLFMIPLPAIVFNEIAFPLQLLASKLGVEVLRSLSLPVFREGNVIVLPGATLEVAEACSGIRSLISLGMVAALYGYLAFRHWTTRWAAGLSAVPIALAANALRIAITGVLTFRYGTDVALGFLHAMSGWVLFGASMALLLGWCWLLRRSIARLPTAWALGS